MNFWREDVWLSPNLTWKYFDEHEGYARFSDLWYPLPAALLLLCLRCVIEQKIFRGLGIWFGIEYAQSEDDRSLSFWFNRKLRYTGVPEKLDKFCETGWRWTAYAFLHIAGMYIIHKKSWFRQTVEIWYGFPKQHYIDNDIWYYYMMELTFYWSLFISQFFDVKRKDFMEMFVHHIATISLMVFSWTCHFHRIGSLVMYLHDFSDHWLEMAKLARYTNYKKMCDFWFLMFMCVWVLTRLGVFPVWLIFSILLEAGQILEIFPIYYMFISILTGLLVLHLFWTYFIVQAGYKALVHQAEVDDSRSERGDSSQEELSELEEMDEKMNEAGNTCNVSC